MNIKPKNELKRFCIALAIGKADKQIIMLFTPDEYSASVRAMYDGSAEVRELSLSEDESHVEGIED